MPHRPTVVLLGVLVAVLTSSCAQEADAPAAAPVPAATASPGPSQPPAPTPPPSASPSPSAGATMTISSFEYVLPASVRPGAQVRVVNQDREAHTVTVDRGAVRLTVLPGETAVFTAPGEPGPHPLTCDLHAGMDAVLVVA